MTANQEKLENVQIFGTKYVGMGSNLQAEKPNPSRSSTLQQPVIQTIKRDLMKVVLKVRYVFQVNQNQNDLQKLRKDWDLWGPLLITLLIATTVTLSTKNDSTEQLFTNLFVILWIGPFVISMNSRLLGANIGLIQSICLIIYCTSPIMILSIIILIMSLIYASFIVNVILSIVALFFTVRGSKQYFRSLVAKDKQYLILYPVILFYLFLGTYISMA